MDTPAEVELEEIGLDTAESDEETQRLIAESHRKTLPVNILWAISTGLAILAVLWAMLAALSRRKYINARELPYLGFLFANLLVLLIVEIPDIAIFTTGQQVHNEWSKFVYDTANNIPLFNFAWIGLQSWIQVTYPDWISMKKSFGLGGLLWFLGIAFALPFSFAFSLIDEDNEYMAKFIPLFMVSFLLQKALPIIFAIITVFLAISAATSRIEGYCENRARKCCWTLSEKPTRIHIFDMVALFICTMVWISQDIHVMFYLFNGNNLAGLELYHIAIYNLMETTGIFVAECLVISGNDNLRRIQLCNDSGQEPVESCSKSINASVNNLITSSVEDPENNGH